MDTSGADADDIFAANRAVGEIALAVESTSSGSRRTRSREAGSLRVRFPGSAHGLEAVIINTAGGAAGGDRYALDVAVGEGASLTVTSAAAEKVYRSLGPRTEVAIRLRVAEGGSLAWVPQETILFDRSRLDRSIDVDLAEGASLLLAEALVFGRSAMGEAVEHGHVRDRWRVRRGGRLIVAEGLRLDGDIASQLDERAVAAKGAAVATVLKVPCAEAAIAPVRALDGQFAGEVGISAWNGFAVARLCARDGAALRHDLIAVLAAFGGHALPRLWLN
jgi:urease accessory protein